MDDLEDFEWEDAPEISYNPDIGFSKPFWDFAEGFNSLYRYWVLNLVHLPEILKKRKTELESGADWIESQGLESGRDLIEDEHKTDQEYFLRILLPNSVLAHLFSLTETLLNGIGREMALTEGIKFTIPDGRKRLPEIEKYLGSIKDLFGVKIKFEAETNKKINHYRELRNRYVHQLTRELPEEVKNGLAQFYEGLSTVDESIPPGLINDSFNLFKGIAEHLEEEYSNWYSSQNK